MIRLAIILMILAFAMAFAQAVNIHPKGAQIASQHRTQLYMAQKHLKDGDVERGMQVLGILAGAEYAPAEARLGLMYFKGEGVDVNMAVAAIWFYRSARQGLASAQLALGSLYIEGKGVAADFVQAHLWLSLATNRNEGAIGQRADILIAQIEPKMTRDQLIRARSLWSNWKPVRPLETSFNANPEN